MSISRRTLLAGVGAASSLPIAGARAQGAWPDRPVRLIVGWPPGGSTDGIARIIQQKLNDALGRPLVIENRGGASGSIGAGEVARAPADGYTWLLAFDTHAVNPALMRLPYDGIKDFAPVTLVARGPMALVVHPSTPWQTIQDYVAAAKKDPESINYATSGAGTLAHLAMTQLADAAGFKVTHVPYRGGGPAMQDALAGHVPSYMTNLFLPMPHIRAGRMRILAVTSKERWRDLPDVPTLSETVAPGFEAYTWWAVFGPKGTPEPIVKAMHEKVTTVLRDPEITRRIGEQAADVVAGSPQELQQFVDAEAERWAAIVKKYDIRAEG
ncbi:Bug family tripartite tricarboxylate transporter substrate binding protein [Elioraea rosea]|uniref:Bug family tripartite tricarboxylate transporter substrate binding protein n=1 Tax=Elioraea rosea TaxID=2492390 RepID=UPI001181DEFD|nr:tripartite tricarboxylate transporter substrate binding protein [Elioraea rosea]